MVIGFMPLSDLLRLDFPQELPVHRHPDTTGGRRLVLFLEDVGQMMEQRNDGRHGRLAQPVIHVFQKVLSVLIPLVRRQLEPLDCAGPIFWTSFPSR